MWNVKSTLLFVASLIAVILISISMANADEKKTIKEYQKKSWADMKTKWPWTMFKGKDNE